MSGATLWREVALGDICEFKYGKSLPDAARAGGDVPVFGSNGVVGSHNDAVTEGTTIVIGRKGSYGEVNFSPVACWPIDTTYYVDRTATEQDLKWLAYRLTGLRLNTLNKAAAVPGLNREDAYRQRLLLPPLAEQRRIAAILDKADALRTKRRQALTELNTLTQSIFLEMFGDPATNPKNWPVTTLSDLARTSPNNGIFRKNDEYSTERTTGLPVVWVEELFRGDCISTASARRLRPTPSDVERYGLRCGDLLFCRSSLKLDGIAYNNVYLGPNLEALFECHIIRISPDTNRVVPTFLNCLLRTPAMRALAKSKSKTATMTTIDQASLGSISVLLPPVPLQQRFERVLHAISDQRKVQDKGACKAESLFAALQQRAFRGEL